MPVMAISRSIVSDAKRTRPSLDIVRRPKTTPIHELERSMRCKVCSELRGYPYKRKISRVCGTSLTDSIKRPEIRDSRSASRLKSVREKTPVP
jgi:hypothetical protein